MQTFFLTQIQSKLSKSKLFPNEVHESNFCQAFGTFKQIGIIKYVNTFTVDSTSVSFPQNCQVIDGSFILELFAWPFLVVPVFE